jgi:hypothetical protein
VKVLSSAEAALAKSDQWRQVYRVPPEIQEKLSGKEGEDFFRAGTEVAGNLLKQIKEENLADGVYLKAKGRADLLARVLEAAGL